MSVAVPCEMFKISQVLLLQDHSHKIIAQHHHNIVNVFQHSLCLSACGSMTNLAIRSP